MLDIVKTQAETIKRINNLGLFFPFFKIYSERNNSEDYDTPSLILSVLSLILYEGKLKEKGISFEQIKEHIRIYLRDVYDHVMGEEDLEKLTRDTILKLDDVYEYETIEPVLKKKKTTRISLVKIDVKTLLYHITSEGMDFFLKTLEYQDASGIEITLLLIQLQLKNNTYGEIIEMIDRLRIGVAKLLDEKTKILETIANDSSNGFRIYESYHKRIYEHLKSERELFSSTIAIVLESSENLRKSQADADKQAIAQLGLIEKKLESMSNLHLGLFGGMLETSAEYDKIIHLKMKSAFSEKFNFDAVFDKMLFSHQSVDVLSAILSPLMNLNVNQQFSIAKIFNNQRLSQTDEDKPEVNALEVLMNYETVDKLVSSRVNTNYLALILVLTNLLLEKSSVSLSELRNYIMENLGEVWINNIDFVPFLARINGYCEKPREHKKTIRFAEIVNEKRRELSDIETCIKIAVEQNPKLSNKTLSVETQPEEDVVFNDIVKITQMIFSLT